jgi:hypothetical protein
VGSCEQTLVQAAQAEFIEYLCGVGLRECTQVERR